MKKYVVIFGLVVMVVSFMIYLLGLMHLLPLYFGAPILFMSILFMVYCWNNRNRFKGFKTNKKLIP